MPQIQASHSKVPPMVTAMSIVYLSIGKLSTLSCMTPSAESLPAGLRRQRRCKHLRCVDGLGGRVDSLPINMWAKELQHF